MDKISIFSFDGHDVRAAMWQGEPVMVLKDATDVLGYTNAGQVTRWLDSNEYETVKFGDVFPGHAANALDASRRVVIVREFGLYELIFRSDKDEAVRFKSWVKRVLREIREDGTYVPEALSARQRERAYGKLARVELTDELKAHYDRLPQSVPFGITAANYTKMLTCSVLDISPVEFRDRKAAAGGNFRDGATEGELRLLRAAEDYAKARLAFAPNTDLKTLFAEIKQSLPALAGREEAIA